jgi:hypothetical protein
MGILEKPDTYAMLSIFVPSNPYSRIEIVDMLP